MLLLPSLHADLLQKIMQRIVSNPACAEHELDDRDALISAVKAACKALRVPMKLTVIKGMKMVKEIMDDAHLAMRRVFAADMVVYMPRYSAVQPRNGVFSLIPAWTGAAQLMLSVQGAAGMLGEYLLLSTDRLRIKVVMCIRTQANAGAPRVEYEATFWFMPLGRRHGVVLLTQFSGMRRLTLSYRGAIMDVLCSWFAFPWTARGFIPHAGVKPVVWL